MVTAEARRAAVSHARAAAGLAERRACRFLGVARASCRYQSRRPPASRLRERLCALAQERPRWGYRRLLVLLRREGEAANWKRVYRLYRAAGLAVGRRRRKRVTRRPQPRPTPARPNERWSMDFILDALADGRRFRSLCIVDDFTRECAAIVVDRSLPGARVIQVLEQLAATRSLPTWIVCDNGPEFSSQALDAWAYARGIALQFIEPGKPVQNAVVESFHGRLRDECLNQHWFTSLDDARRTIETWRRDYNEIRPHSGLGGRTPCEFAQACAAHEPQIFNLRLT